MTGAVAAGLAVAAPAAGAATTGAVSTPNIAGAAGTQAGKVTPLGPIAKVGSGAGGTVSGALKAAAGTASAAGGQGKAVLNNLLSSGPSGVKAPYADLTDAGVGLPMWSRSQDTKVPMGSITKVMTAYVVIESGNLGRLITVPAGITAYDNKYGGSTAGLKPGEKLTAGQLLYAMLLPSGCDAAYALASAYGPGLPGFIAKMNAAAARLGMTNTHFSDFSGLPDPTEYSTYSTARDLVTLGRAAMSLPLFASIVARPGYRLPAQAGLHPAFNWKTTNPLTGTYAGTAGIKTGNTEAAGDCLLFEAKRNGRTLIGVVLDEPSFGTAASDAEQMMNWGWKSI